MAEGLDKPWTATGQDVLRAFSVSADRGLDAAAVEQNRQKYGRNQLREIKRKSAWLILVEQFKSPIVALLAVAAAVSFVFEDWVEGVAILVVIVINATIGFFTELQAIRSMEALHKLSSAKAKVRRDGHLQEIPAEEVVPGDLVVLEAGDSVAADLRLIEAANLQIDESALTGESVPVSKELDPLDAEVSLAERINMLFKGTAITSGSGTGVVVTTGMNTELGHISSLVEEADKEKSTPLEQRLDQLGRNLIWITLAIAALVAVAGILRGKDLVLMVQTAIALSVAAIPEGLPIVATIALARGMWRMARRHALINHLSAVETLGATSVICTDKTGTLTENKMTVTRLSLADGDVDVGGDATQPEERFMRDKKSINSEQHQSLRQALEVGVLCNNADLRFDVSEADQKSVGDPMEVALLVVGAKAGLRRDQLVQHLSEVREEAFNTDTKMMATFHETEHCYRVAVKGAPEPVLKASTHLLSPTGVQSLGEAERQQWRERNQQLAAQGLRVLALATKIVDNSETNPYENLTFLGLVGLNDPPRQDVGQALAECKAAGIRVVMVTGDQPVTARSIGVAVGLVDAAEQDNVEVIQGKDIKRPEELSDQERRRMIQSPILARVSPEQKLNLIALHQRSQAIVAMTGDGVNDAPALKKADIGIAMGQRGTQVAREAADMVLTDDAFSTIVAAVRQGRAIFGNIRKFTLYLLSGNVDEIIIVALASLITTSLPILPLQILFLNLVNDVFPALALGVGKGDPSLMQHPPRNAKEPILARRHWLAIGGYGVLIAITVLGAFAIASLQLQLEERQVVTVSFLTLSFGWLWHVFNMRDRGSHLLRNDITQNPFIWGAVLVCTGLLLTAVYFPPLAALLRVTTPTFREWFLIIGMSLIPLVIGQVLKLGRRHNKLDSQVR
jgi:Ca2+-transporting ATPase